MAAGIGGVERRSLRQVAYAGIEELLNSGVLQPGQVVSQRELVEMTGSTLGSVRESIPKLEAEGLLVTLPKRGLMIPSLDVRFVRDAYQLRSMLETSCLGIEGGGIDRTLLSEWITQHERLLGRATHEGDESLAEELQRLDWAMHGAIVASADNALLNNVYRVTAIKIRMAVQSRIRVTPSNVERVVSEHLAFLRPLRDGDRSRADTALRRHISNSATLALGVSLVTADEVQ